MRSLVRTVIAAALAVLVALVPAAAASAKQPAPAKWAKQHHFKGHWRKRDADKDGLANLREFKLKTDPRRADTDRDGLRDADELAVGDDPRVADSNRDGTKDGADHAGVVVSFDGTTLVLRQFHGPRLTATVDADVDCYTAGSSDDHGSIGDDDPAGDDSTADDDGEFGDDGEDWTTSDDDEGDDLGDDDPSADAAGADLVDLGGVSDDDDSADDEEPTCADAGVEPGAVVRSLSVDRDGGALVVYTIELAA
jgi:hypothetical protein